MIIVEGAYRVMESSTLDMQWDASPELQIEFYD